MSRTRILAYVVLAIVIPLALGFTAFSLSRTIGSSGAPSVPGLVHHQDSGPANDDPRDTRKAKPSATTGRTGTGTTVNPTPTDDHGGDRSGDSGSSGPGGGDDSGKSGSSDSSGPGSGGGSGDD